tara:strand:+ start:68 stop:451 length:384 start_codon:yes stop_codon:yes gene_type:complete
MTYFRRVIKVDDNSGADYIRIFKVLKKKPKSDIAVGDKLIGSVQEIFLRKMKRKKKAVKKGIYQVVLVRVRSIIKRNSYYIKSRRSGIVVLIKDSLLPLGNRILNPVFLELRLKGFLKILMLAKYII